MGRNKASAPVSASPSRTVEERGFQEPARKISGTRLKQQVAPSPGRTLTQTRVHLFPSDVGLISAFVDELLRDRDLDPRDVDELGLALRELLLNAVEHGNLDLSFEDKSNGLAAGTWKQTLAERAQSEPYCHRMTRVIAHWAPERVAFTITDDGRGFDWRSLPDPTDPANILRDNGRGVLMARMSVDALNYSAAGNEVTIVKRLR